MSIVNATRAQVVQAATNLDKLSIALRQIEDGSGKVTAPGRFTVVDVDALVEDVLDTVGVLKGAVEGTP